jgi:hypothetical protein
MERLPGLSRKAFRVFWPKGWSSGRGSASPEKFFPNRLTNAAGRGNVLSNQIQETVDAEIKP